jgi:periplasmic mercuric ion binding protein
MKKYIIKLSAIMVFTLLFSLSSLMAQDKSDLKIKEIKIKTSSQCGMCKKAIEKAVNKLDGIEKADLNIETHILTVKYNIDDVSPEEIRKAVSKAGYDADDVPADKSAYRKLPKCCQKGGH